MEIRAVTALRPGEGAGLPGGFQAWEGGRLVGTLTLAAPLGRAAEVSGFVVKEHRRQGVFTALWREAEAAFSDPARQCWGLWEREDLTAAACVGPAGEGLSLYGVAVDPAHQGQGLGRRLMAALLAVLPRDKALVVEVDGGNRPARALYEGFGFRERRRQDYFALDR